MENLEKKLKSALTPGGPSAKIYFGLAFFVIALLIVLLGVWKALFIAAVTALGVLIGSAETLGKAVAKVVDKVYPQKNQKVVYTQEDLEKVRKAAEQNRKQQVDLEAKAEEGKSEE